VKHSLRPAEEERSLKSRQRGGMFRGTNRPSLRDPSARARLLPMTPVNGGSSYLRIRSAILKLLMPPLPPLKNLRTPSSILLSSTGIWAIRDPCPLSQESPTKFLSARISLLVNSDLASFLGGQALWMNLIPVRVLGRAFQSLEEYTPSPDWISLARTLHRATQPPIRLGFFRPDGCARNLCSG